MNSYTIKLDAGQAARLAELLGERGWDRADVPYAKFAFRGPGVSVACYAKDLKLVVQGKGAREFIEFTLEPEITGQALLGNEEVSDPGMFEPHFGVDESGKGDYLGPLVVAGVYTDAVAARQLLDHGVCDSKQVGTSRQIARLAALIRATPGVEFSVMTIGPERYNQLHTQMGNLNYLLAWAHIQIIADLKAKVPGCGRALSDKFAHESVLKKFLAKKGLKIQLDQRTKAESDVTVAAASVLARHQFVTWMERAGEKSGIRLPLGASPAVVSAAREVVKKYGEEMLGKVAKLHFKTTLKVLGR